MTLATSLTETGAVSSGETVLFWVLAPLVVIAALGLLLARRPVHAALSVVFVMIGLAVFYIAQDATFLGLVQIVVYTGAIMMLFLFVIMLVGVDSSDSAVETLKGQRLVAALAGAGVLLSIVGIVVTTRFPDVQGLAGPNQETNIVGLAGVMFGQYAVTMQLAAVLLITAAVGAITYAHRQRIGEGPSQRRTADAKMAAFGADGSGRIRSLPAPGVYAGHNATDVPAIGPDGEPIVDSVPRVLRVRGQMRDVGEFSSAEAMAVASAQDDRRHSLPGLSARTVPQAGGEGMPGLDLPPGETTAEAESRGDSDGRGPGGELPPSTSTEEADR